MNGMRVGVLFLVIATGCGASSQRLREAEEMNELLRQQIKLMQHPSGAPVITPPSAPAIRAPEAYRTRPLVAFVDEKPAFCNGARCLALTSWQSYPIAMLRINGQPVTIESRNGMIGPQQTAYIRFPLSGTFIIEGDLVDVVRSPGGDRPTTSTIGTCRLRNVHVGTLTDAHWGGANAEFGAADCRSVGADHARLARR
ncbi:hypothetical protein HY632_01565 [Candidatus Uhrbacteria bacterium]|nr:hypothetical protein [Candidatus Uhrbacteria bacterium]